MSDPAGASVVTPGGGLCRRLNSRGEVCVENDDEVANSVNRSCSFAGWCQRLTGCHLPLADSVAGPVKWGWIYWRALWLT